MPQTAFSTFGSRSCTLLLRRSNKAQKRLEGVSREEERKREMTRAPTSMQADRLQSSAKREKEVIGERLIERRTVERERNVKVRDMEAPEQQRRDIHPERERASKGKDMKEEKERKRERKTRRVPAGGEGEMRSLQSSPVPANSPEVRVGDSVVH